MHRVGSSAVMCWKCIAAVLEVGDTDQPPQTSSAPLVSSTLVISHVPIRPWTTVELLELVWPLCQGTGNVEPADRVTPGFGPSSLTLHLSTLV